MFYVSSVLTINGISFEALCSLSLHWTELKFLYIFIYQKSDILTVKLNYFFLYCIIQFIIIYIFYIFCLIYLIKIKTQF